MAKPKLCLIPATIGDKVYSILPSDGVGDFDFTRASTATRINAQGLIETVASGENRLNYSLLDGEVVGCPHLLLEPESRNQFLQSNNFNTSWTVPSGLTLTANQLSPISGGLDAWKLESDGSNGFLAINQNVSTSGTNTFSIYAKAGTNKYISLRGLSALDVRAQFDLENGDVYGSNNVVSTEIKHIKDDWYRCSFTYNASNAAFYIYPSIQGVSDAGYIFIQNAQLEDNSYSTSYIPTTSAAVTRAAETCTGSGNAATFNDSEGVLMAEISALVNDSDTKRISLSDGTSSNRISLYLSDETIGGVVVSGGSVGFSTSVSGYDATLNNKILFKYKENDFSIFVNGFEILTDTSGATPIGLNELRFDNGYSGNDFYGNTKQIQYFDSILDSEQLEQLTSWDSFRAMAEGQLYSVE